MIMDIPETSHQTMTMIATEDTPTDEQQTNWIKDEWLGWKGVQIWERRLGWGGGMGGGKWTE